MAGRKVRGNKKSTAGAARGGVGKRTTRSQKLRSPSAGTPFKLFGYAEHTRISIVSTPKLKETREKAGLSIRQLAKATGMSSGHLSKIELGQRSVSSEKAREIEATLQAARSSRQAQPSQAGR